jgi:hypothetical protein
MMKLLLARVPRSDDDEEEFDENGNPIIIEPENGTDIEPTSETQED